jgi:HTH-type transcriptional regulator / antitoxin HipB
MTKGISYTLDEVQDKISGTKGTNNRNQFAYELQVDLVGKAIKESRQERILTQEQVSQLVGFQKAQVSRLESSASHVTIDTLLKVFTALKANVKLQVELPHAKVELPE